MCVLIHVIFICPHYATIRQLYVNFLNKYPVVESVFNPRSVEDAVTLEKLLIAIDLQREKLGLNLNVYFFCEIVVCL